MMRQEQAERTRANLLDAAAHEFCVHGYDGTRIQDILDRAQVTKGGLYHHFTTKRQMADALAEQEQIRWPIVIDEVAAEQARGLAAIELLSATIARTLQEEPASRAILKISDEIDLAVARRTFTLWQDFVILSLQQAIADGVISDSVAIREVASTILECVYSIAATCAPFAADVPAHVRLDRLWSMLLPGLRAITH